MDQGGELYINMKVISRLKKYGYEVLPTVTDFFQNSPIECAHQVVSQGINLCSLV